MKVRGPAKPAILDAVIVGGGAAGSTAAILLGRCRRTVVMFDAGRQRNTMSQALHGFPTREGIAPTEWLRATHTEVDAYGVERIQEEITAIRPHAGGFTVRGASGRTWRARKVLLATGVRDLLPDLPGFSAFYGKSVFHCPYCDGWEVRGQPLAAYGLRNRAVALALNLRNWSADVMLFTDGHARLRPDERKKLAAAGITLHTEKVRALEGDEQGLRHVVLASGERVVRTALFFSNGHRMQCDLAVGLGCRTWRTGAVITDRKQRTGVPGLFVAGDASMDIHFVTVACAEGAKAAVAIHRELCAEDGLA